jgi:hypothetical protein
LEGYLSKLLNQVFVAGMLLLSGFYITESLVAEDKHNLASAWGMEQSAITRIAYLCLDNPIEQFFISKHAILSITKSKGYSYQRAPELNRNDFSVVLQAYGLFAIPLAKIEIKFSDHQFAGCTRL